MRLSLVSKLAPAAPSLEDLALVLLDLHATLRRVHLLDAVVLGEPLLACGKKGEIDFEFEN